MSGELNDRPLTEGEHYLHLLGLEHLASVDITAQGKTLPAKEFLQFCGDHARPMLMGLEAMDPNDPDYETTKTALHGLIGRFIEGDKTH